ncbi:MAG: 1-phosphofructokinase family hexose kinase [Candidatus Caldatribacteriota bacterium]
MIATVTLNPALDLVLEVEELKLDHYNKINNISSTAGGKGINVSKAIKSCQRDTVTLGFVGGNRGRIIEEELRSSGITTNFWHIEGETRSNIIIWDKKRNQHTLLSEIGPLVTEYDLEMFYSIYSRIMSQCKAVTLSGSLPPGVPVDVYGKLISIAKEREIKTILNAAGEAFERGLEKGPYLAKPDLREKNQILGKNINTEKDAIQIAQEITQQGAEIAVVSFEQKKDIIATHQELWFAETVHHKIVNLIGAADALVAGLAVALTEEEKEFSEAIKFSMAAALASALREEEEFNSREEVENCLHYVKIKKY